jgi:DNA-binding MarR family transcriptional regulator
MRFDVSSGLCGRRRSNGTPALTAGERFVLHALRDRPAQSLNELAERTYTDQSTASPVVNRLRARGLLRRERSAEDGRRVVIALTRTGRAAIDDAPDAPQAAIVAALKKLSPGDRRTIARSLTRLVAAMGLSDERASMLFEDMRKR